MLQTTRLLNPQFISMIMPSRWFAGGMGLDAFRTSMLQDKHIISITDYTNSKDCFPQISISGGVCYFLWGDHWNGDCVFTNIKNGEIDTMTRPLDEFDVLVRYNTAVSIIRKVKQFDENSLATITSSLMPFGLGTDIRGNSSKTSPDELKLYASDGVSFINRNQITKGEEYINAYKVLISKTSAEHAGEPGSDGKFKVIPSSMKVIFPNEVCTHSYFLIGCCKEQEEADNILSYMNTRFVRFLILLSISGFGLSKLAFTFVPLQKFNRSWSDNMLYKKYNLSDEEIIYIESMIKPAAQDSLFSTEETVAPEFANFNLAEYGANPGDTLIYTPLGLEVNVVDNNHIEYEGEKYTLSVFTAKFMPHNKRSTSGFCQGPKYFTKGGVSLYKLKESFLVEKKNQQ